MRYQRLLFVVLILFALLLACSGQKQPATVKQITNASYVTGIAADGNTAYCATHGGLVIWDLAARKYTLLTTADGIPSNTLTDVIIDGKGKLWVGSDAGAAVREGSSWKYFDASNGMPSNLVKDLALDPDKNVWAGTDKGVVSFKGGRAKLIDDKEGPGDADVQCVYFDSGKNIWIGTVNQGIFANLQGVWRELSSRDGLILNTAGAIGQNWDNSIWAGSWAGVNRWDGQGFQSVSVKKNIGTFETRDLVPTRELLWFFTANGVHAMKGSEWTHYTEAEGLISNDVTCGFVVSDDRVFAGAPNGMSLIEKGVVINYAIPNTPFGKDFISLTVDGKNRLFAGTRDGGLNIFESGFWALLPGINEKTFKTVQSIVLAPNGSPVFNTAEGIVTLRDRAWTVQTRENGIAGNDIRCGVYDRQGKYWVGTTTGVSCLSGGVWSRYRAGHGLPSENVRACALDSTGTVWFGTAGGIVSFADNKMTDWTKQAGADSIDVLSVAVSGGKVFFGTSDGKLIEYDGSSWKSSGKAAAGISAILAGSSGELWLGSDGAGVLRTGKGGEAKYTTAEGLPSNRVRALAIHDGQLVAACYGGIGIIPLEK
ncbi:MAG: ligand-binding sensor domain-containing protein [Candidatus Latescibacterota bacterium]